MNGITRPAVLIGVLLLAGMAPRQEQSIELRSPNGRTVLVAGVLEHTSGNCGYALSHDGRTILRPSAFALTFRDEPAFGEHLRVAAVARSRSAGRSALTGVKPEAGGRRPYSPFPVRRPAPFTCPA